MTVAAPARSRVPNSFVATAIEYPVPIHLQPVARHLGHAPGDFPMAERQAERMPSLPVHAGLTLADHEYVSDAIHRFHDDRPDHC